MVRDADRKAVADSYQRVAPASAVVADHFYRRLFELRPEYESLFGTKLKRQKRKFEKMLRLIVETMSWDESDWREDVDVEADPCLIVMALGKRHHRLHKIPSDSFEPFGQALLWSLEASLGDDFTAREKQAWTRMYRGLALTMRMGAYSKVELELGDGA